MGLAEDIVRAACEIKTNPDQVIGYCFENGEELRKIVEDKKTAGGDFPETSNEYLMFSECERSQRR